MDKPKLITPPPPEFGYFDLDSVLFKAAQAGQQVYYIAKDKNGETVAEFKSAEKYKNWIDSIEFLGSDLEYGYTGDAKDLTREVEYEIGDVKNCYRVFDKILNDWIRTSGCNDWVGYVGKSTGEKNFRYDIATLKGYKSGRNSNHPHYLEKVRKYAASHPKIKIARGNVEVDDVTCGLAQRRGYKGCVVSVDKDALGCTNTHVFNPDVMSKPLFSSKKIIGRLYPDQNGKIVGFGTLFWLHQMIYGDQVDSIPGCKGIGEKGSYKLLKDFDGVDAAYLPDAIRVVCEAFKNVYGDVYTYQHCSRWGEFVEASWRELAVEMSHLVYMKKNQKDECFWIPLIMECDI